MPNHYNPEPLSGGEAEYHRQQSTIERLQDELAAAEASVGELEEELVKLRWQCSDCGKALELQTTIRNDYQAKLEAAESAIATERERGEAWRKLATFANHTEMCAMLMDEGEFPCRCGYAAALAATEVK